MNKISKIPRLNYLRSLLIVCIFTFSISIFSQDSEQSSDELAKKGHQLAKGGKYDEALILLKQSLKLNSKDAFTYDSLGLVYIGLRQYGKAVENLNKAVQLLPNNSEIRNNFCIALNLNKELEKGLFQCEEAHRLAPDSPRINGNLAETLKNLRRVDEAIEIVKTSLLTSPEEDRLLLLLSNLYAEKSDFLSSLGILEKLVQIKPKVSAYQVALSEAYLRFDRVDEAASTASKAIDADALNPFAYYRLASVYYEIGMNEEAVSALQKAVELKPDAGAIYYLYGQSLSKMGNSAQAIVNLREAVRLMPDHVSALYELGKTLNSDARFAEAVAPLRRAEKLKSNDLDIKVELGLALFESGSFDDALKYLQEADKLKPSNKVIQMFLSVTRARKKGVQEIEQLKQFVSSHPDDAQAKTDLGDLYRYIGNIAEATKLKLEAFKQLPETFETNNDLSVFFTDTRRLDLAIKYTRRAIELKPHHVLYLSLADNLIKLGRLDEAFEAYKKALEIRPNYPSVLRYYAKALRDNGKKKESVEIYKKLLEVEPNNSTALFNLSLLYFYFLDRPNAQIYYEKLNQVDKNMAKNLSWIFILKK